MFDVAREHRPRARAVASAVVTVLAVLLIWVALIAPDEITRLELRAYLGVPLEGILIFAVILVLPRRVGLVLAALAGCGLGLLAILKVLDVGFFSTLGRPFNPVVDWSYLDSAAGVLGDSIGRPGAVVAILALAILALAVLVLLPSAAIRITRVVGRHRAGSTGLVAAVAAGVIICAVAGVQVVPGTAVVSTNAIGLTVDRTRQIVATVANDRTFATTAAIDPLRTTPGSSLLNGLRGKDVIVAFVESYGRVAVQDSSFSPQVDALLDTGTEQLRDAGFSARSAFLTSPTFGGVSWLAHSTFQTGLWIDSQQHYNQIVTSNRSTLSDAFKRAGWRTVGDVPSNRENWPEGTDFYHYDQIYDARNVGYAGPDFSYASMPDQYILSAFRQRELAKSGHLPVMAEIDLVSSHAPWAPLPHMIDWNALGDGSVFNEMAAEGDSPDVVWRDPDRVRAAYAQSIEYSLSALISFVQTFGDKNLVLVVLGDHQPATIVSGRGASHDVPISVIAADPAVLDRISSWNWQDGLRPDPSAPVWPMNSFRDRFLSAFGTRPH